MYEKALIRHGGTNHEFILTDLDLSNPDNPSDGDLLQALCIALETPNLDGYVATRFETVIKVHPDPTFAKE